MARERRGGPRGETACVQYTIRVTPTESSRLERAAHPDPVYQWLRRLALAATLAEPDPDRENGGE